jgi:hypothetical protein
MVMLVKPVFRNAAVFMFITLSGMVMLFKLVQFRNILPLMVVKFWLSGNLTLSKPAQPSNALMPMVVTLLGKTMLVKLMHLKNALVPMEVRLLPAKVTLLRLWQLMNASFPIEVTPAPIRIHSIF